MENKDDKIIQFKPKDNVVYKSRFALRMERARKIIHPSRIEKFKKIVLENPDAPQIEFVLNIMEFLHDGEKIQDVKYIFDCVRMSEKDRLSCLTIIALYVNRGPEFYRCMVENISEEMNRTLYMVEFENSAFEQRKKDENDLQ